LSGPSPRSKEWKSLLIAVRRLVSAIRDGRLRSSIYRWVRVRFPFLWGLPSISWNGDFGASAESARLQDCFEKADRNISRLSEKVRRIEGMSGQKYRSFINNFVHATLDARYLEIGSWAGSTATAALFDNQAKALCIDNWSEFGSPRLAFFVNMGTVRSEKVDFRVIEDDFRSVDYSSVGSFNIYVFDGPHKEVDQYDGIMLVQPALTERFLLIVDDWNWREVRDGTFKGLSDARCRIESSIEVRTTLDNSHAVIRGKTSDWHNGYFLGIIVKAS
jgi:hypothetical protein